MGVCNVTPDSFSDGGRYLAHRGGARAGGRARWPRARTSSTSAASRRGRARRRCRRRSSSRACSRWCATRRAAAPASSIDTTSPVVAAACLDAGACAVNDVSCLRDAELGAGRRPRSGAALVLMHARGTQDEMRGFSAYPDDAYGDVVDDVLARVGGGGRAGASARASPREALVMDPGLGFAKNARHSARAPARARASSSRASASRSPSARAASRSSPWRGTPTGRRREPPTERLGASLAAAPSRSAARRRRPPRARRARHAPRPSTSSARSARRARGQRGA